MIVLGRVSESMWKNELSAKRFRNSFSTIRNTAVLVQEILLHKQTKKPKSQPAYDQR